MFIGFPGPAELVILLALGGGAGLPLGIPPAPEETLLAKVAPEECLFYTTWAGTATPKADSTNQTEQLLAEPEVQQMLAEIERRITSALRQAAQREDPGAVPIAEDASKWAKILLTRPTALFISRVGMTESGPDIRGGALVCVDEDAPQLKATLEKYQQMFLQGAAKPVQIGGAAWYRIKPDPKAPAITWGVRGRYLIVGLGEGSLEGILSRARTDPPPWLADIRKQLPVERTATVTYVNVKKIANMLVPLAGTDAPKVQAVLGATGLDQVTSLCSVTGLDKSGFVNRTLIGLSGEPGGLFAFAAAKPLTAEDLAPIPADATIALAARIDLEAVFDTLLSVAEKIEPGTRDDALAGLSEIEMALGLSLRNDLLKALGDTWCVYNSPSEGGLVITGLTVVVPVKDRQVLAGLQEKLVALARAQMGFDLGGRRGPRIEQFKFAGRDVYFFNAREVEFPLAPAWCLTEKALVVAPFPQNIKAYLTRGDDFKSLATVPEVAELFQPAGGPVVLSYSDTRKLFELIYPLVPMGAQMALSELAREGIDVSVSILPSAGAIAPHLRPGVAAVRRHAAGIEMLSRQSLPGGSIGATAPIAVALGLPAVSSARGAARRAQSMNNLKQIALAMHNHHAAYKGFPAAYSSDATGKPLLSWRVKILPFIEEEALYRQFKLNEPWDSEHNKKLIAAMPETYKAPGSAAGEGKTNYLTVRGKDTAFPGKEKIRLAQITDGSSQTAMVVEASDQKAVIWTKPDDFEYDDQNPIAGLVGLRPGGFIVAFCDGSVQFMFEGVSPNGLKRLFTRNDGKPVRHEEPIMPGRRGAAPAKPGPPRR